MSKICQRGKKLKNGFQILQHLQILNTIPKVVTREKVSKFYLPDGTSASVKENPEQETKVPKNANKCDTELMLEIQRYR
jgi:hypothetical protein